MGRDFPRRAHLGRRRTAPNPLRTEKLEAEWNWSRDCECLKRRRLGFVTTRTFAPDYSRVLALSGVTEGSEHIVYGRHIELFHCRQDRGGEWSCEYQTEHPEECGH